MKRFITLLGALLLNASLILAAPAAYNEWTNATQNGKWSEPLNWSLGTVPGAADEAHFDAVNDDCTIDVVAAPEKIKLKAGYTGTVSVEANVSTAHDVDVKGGTLIFQAGLSISIGHKLKNDGGVLKIYDCTLSAAEDIELKNGNSEIHNSNVSIGKDLKLEHGSFSIVNCEITVAEMVDHRSSSTGNVRMTSIQLDGNTFEVNPGFDCDQCEVILKGGRKDVMFNGTGSLYELTIDLNDGDTAVFVATDVISITNSLELIDGCARDNNNITANEVTLGNDFDGTINFSYTSNSSKTALIIDPADVGGTVMDYDWDILLGASNDTMLIVADSSVETIFGDGGHDLTIEEGVVVIDPNSKIRFEYDEIKVEAGATLVLDGEITFTRHLRNQGGSIQTNGGTATFTKNGDLHLDLATTDRFNNVIVDNPNNSDLQLAWKEMHILGDLTVHNGEIDDGYVYVHGNLTFSATADDHDDIDFYLDGKGNTTLDVSSNQDLLESNIHIAKDDPNATVTLLNPIEFDDNDKDLYLDNGILLGSSTNMVHIKEESEVFGGSASSYIDAPLRIYDRRDYTYHVGNDGKYAPVTLSGHQAAGGGGGDDDDDDDGGGGGDAIHFTVTYHAQNPTDAGYHRDSIDGGMAMSASNSEWWDIVRSGGSDEVYVSIGWDDSRSDTVSSISDMNVLHWDGSKWENLGSGNLAGDLISGSVRSQNRVDDFSPFTLPGGGGGTVLDNADMDIIPTVRGEQVELLCEVRVKQSHINYTIERSRDCQLWEEVETYVVTDEPGEIQVFYVMDDAPFTGTSYYRMRVNQIRAEKTYTDKKPVTIEDLFGGLPLGDDRISIFPNPSNGMIELRTADPNEQVVGVKVFDLRGSSFNVPVDLGGPVMRLDLGKVPNGHYMIHAITSNGPKSKRVLIQR